MHHEAHGECFIANSVTTEIRLRARRRDERLESRALTRNTDFRRTPWPLSVTSCETSTRRSRSMLDKLGFALIERWGPPFAMVAHGDLTLWLSGPGSSASRALADGRCPRRADGTGS
jgi:hypothetical protein